MVSLTKDKRMLEYGALAPYSNILCFTTTRQGGYSEGNYASFNCTPYSGDKAINVRRNQELLCNVLPQRPKELIIPHQTHSTNLAVIDKNYLNASSKERTAFLENVDALVTREKGCCICVSTADCIPILLYDPVRQVAAAVHAGWRGTVNYIAAHVLDKMRALYNTDSKDVIACIGPGISLPSFEVGDEVYETFRMNGFAMDYIAEWEPATHKYHIDLWAANRMQLMDSGVPSAQIECASICTYIHQEEFFSARRLGINSGRSLSGIMILI